MNAKLFYQVLLLLGGVALALGVVVAVIGRPILLSPQGWWRGAIAAWVLVIAVRAVYPPMAK